MVCLVYLSNINDARSQYQQYDNFIATSIAVQPIFPQPNAQKMVAHQVCYWRQNHREQKNIKCSYMQRTQIDIFSFVMFSFNWLLVELHREPSFFGRKLSENMPQKFKRNIIIMSVEAASLFSNFPLVDYWCSFRFRLA